MITNVQAQRFLLLFMGKENTYVKNMLPKTKPEKGVKVKTSITNVRGKVDADLMLSHLNGEFGVGICPVMTDGKCRAGVIDIDYYKGKIRKMLDIIRDYQLPLVPFRSKSGGLHCYLFLSRGVSAKTIRDTLSLIIKVFSLDKMYGEEKVEVFPKQDKVTEDGFGSSITLPYFNAEEPYTYLLDLDGNEVPFEEALNQIQKRFTTIEAVREALENLPYNDAPPCLQRILLSGLVGGEDTGRNNFLFSFALYASKKYGLEGFASYVRELNSSFECPIEESAVESTIASIKSKEYSYRCKDIPCNGFCDKSLCKKREFGLGREKGHFSDIEYGQLLRYKTAEPYYVWQLKLQGSEGDFKNIVFRDEGELLDQKNFAKVCVRFLNFAPRQVQTNDWFGTLNKYLASVKDVEVRAESDTSALSMIRQMFVRYLSNKQARRDSPYQIHANLCVRQTYSDESGKPVAKFFFTHTGFAEYLRNNKVNFDQSMLRETLKSFGAVEDTLKYNNSMGDLVEFPCWSKSEDKEIDEAYKGEVEIAEGDKAHSVSEATNITETETSSDEKPYSESDLENIDF